MAFPDLPPRAEAERCAAAANLLAVRPWLVEPRNIPIQIPSVADLVSRDRDRLELARQQLRVVLASEVTPSFAPEPACVALSVCVALAPEAHRRLALAVLVQFAEAAARGKPSWTTALRGTPLAVATSMAATATPLASAAAQVVAAVEALPAASLPPPQGASPCGLVSLIGKECPW